MRMYYLKYKDYTYNTNTGYCACLQPCIYKNKINIFNLELINIIKSKKIK
jgi:hypothetical protein